MKLMKKILLLLFAFALCHLPAPGLASENSPPAQLRNLKKSFKGASGKSRTYDEWFVQRKEVFARDPYLWVYNAEFAKDFHMPERWIDPELVGADAVAFRADTSFPLCGWRGHPDICMPTNLCLVEIYFNHVKNPLPWNNHVRWTDLQIRNTSIWILNSLRNMNRSESKEGGRLSPLVDPNTGNELDWRYAKGPNAPWFGAPTWLAYDRSAFENYSLIILDTHCPTGEISGFELRPFASADRSEKIFHKVTFPKGWVERLSPIVKKINSAESTFFEGQLKEISNSNVGR